MSVIRIGVLALLVQSVQAQSLPIAVLNGLNLLPDLFRWTLPLTGALPLAANSTYNPTGWGASHQPLWMCTDFSGNIYLLNIYGKIDKITPSNVQTTIVGEGAFGSAGTAIAVDPSGNIYVLNTSGGGGTFIKKYTSAGAGPTTFATGLGGSGYIAADSSGNILADAFVGGVDVILSIDPAGVKTTLVTRGGTDIAWGIVVDPSSGHIFLEGELSIGVPTPVDEYTGCGVFVKNIGHFAATSPWPMAYDPATGNFYSIVSAGVTGTTYQMDPSGTVTQFSTSAIAPRNITGPVNGTPVCSPHAYQPGPFVF